MVHTIWKNGQWVEVQETKVPVINRGQHLVKRKWLSPQRKAKNRAKHRAASARARASNSKYWWSRFTQ